MKHPPKKNAPKKNTAAEQMYVRDLQRCGPLEKVELAEASLLDLSEYPQPLKRFLQRERRVLRVVLSSSEKKRLDQLSRATGTSADQLARRWVEQALAREAG